MKKVSLILLVFMICSPALFAQISKAKTTKKKAYKTRVVADWEKDLKEEHSDCAYYNKFTLKQRLARYPFSEAVKILAVSYKHTDRVEPEIIHYSDVMGNVDSVQKIDKSPKEGLIIKKGILDTSTLIERKILDAKQIDKLTGLIFNTDYKKKNATHIEEIGRCFEPRNAVIFLRSDGMVIDYIEICFTCLQAHSDSDKFDIGVLCTQKYKMFSDYFKSIGVNYGTLGRDYHAEDTEF